MGNEPLFEKVTSWENILGAYESARKCKKTRLSVMEFEKEREKNLLRLQEEMRTLAYRTGKYRHFKVYEPKERSIASLPFRDRVMQHAVYRVINPVFDKGFLSGSYACRKGKGSHEAILKVASCMKKQGFEWYLYCDISHFFASIDPKVLKSLIARKIKEPSLLALLYEVIDSSRRSSGMPIGNLLSQLFANIYLHELDFFAAHSIRPKGYARYMDDILIFFETKGEARKAQGEIADFLKKSLHLRLNKRAKVGRFKDSVTFCGAIIKQESIRRKRGALAKVARKISAWEKGKLEDKDIDAILGSSIGLCKGTKSSERLCLLLFKAFRLALYRKRGACASA